MMKAYRVRYTPESSRIIKKRHPTIKAAVRSAMRHLLRYPLAGKELQLDLSGFRSLRVGRYRIIDRIVEEESCLEIHYLGPRRDVYESLRDLLSGKERK